MVQTLDLTYPTLEQLYYLIPRDGALTEGRQHRAGCSSMKISSYTRTWRAYDLKQQPFQAPEIATPVMMMSFMIEGRTFIPLSTLGGLKNIKRIETLGFWVNSFQEIQRHHAFADQFRQSELWSTITDVTKSLFAEIVELFDRYITFIVEKGDFSLEHWKYYVKEHESSASPFGPKWAKILESPALLNLSLDRTTKWLRNFAQKWKSLIAPENGFVYINPIFSYPGVRSRPGEVTIIHEDDYRFIALVRKWRDRKVGGIAGLSQLEFPIYGLPLKKEAIRPFVDWAKKILKCDIYNLDFNGPNVFKFLLEHKDEAKCHDLKMAEKQCGIILKRLPFVTDLGLPTFPAELAGEMYSGIGPTPWINFIVNVIILHSLQVKYGVTFKWACIYSDNFAVDADIPKLIHYDDDETHCGFIPKEGKFGPPSLSTDNPTHRLGFISGQQYQAQQWQYIMRPLIAVIMNSLIKYDSCSRFLDYVTQAEFHTEEAPFWSGDQLKEYILGKNVEYHSQFMLKFPEEVEYVKRWFPVQETDASYATDLRVT